MAKPVWKKIADSHLQALIRALEKDRKNASASDAKTDKA